jgi:glycosyltransferase involved in cell wall biosynthesis
MIHVLFVHQNNPAQFGHVAERLAARHGFRCTFVSEKPGPTTGLVEHVRYAVRGGATVQTHYAGRTFENAVWHTDAVYRALQARPDLRPDLIVGHSGFGSTLFLKELYPGVPVVNLFEYFYRPTGSDMDFRPDFPSTEANRLRAYARNAMILCDLANCDAGYCPTAWQRDRFPAEYRPKLRVIHDGIDTDVWKPRAVADRTVAGRPIPPGMKVVSYATRGMESMRGFDVFMKAANILARRRSDVVFLIAGQDRVAYGGDHAVTDGRSFKAWVLAQGDYDPARFVFTGLLPPAELAKLFSLTDLHVYLTVPFVLSWSLLNALACGATVLASDTAPVREVIRHDENGLLTDFFDTDALAAAADRVLSAPGDYRQLGEAGIATVRDRYGLDVCLPRMLDLYNDCRTSSRGPQACEPATRVRIARPATSSASPSGRVPTAPSG